ncbi:aldo/keto reductase [Halocatena marina]|uniref:aldo/keto reductase n=1 Tax=Halocatena marina TaxID=2934937 RepID=UPI00281553A8|nr:aldo/keto reductase [Halocatena marina]
MSAFDELVDRKLIDHVGVCNFDVDLLDEAVDNMESPLFAHQIETHPLLQQDELIGHAQENDYHHIAYSPLARSNTLYISEITEIAEKHDISASQVSFVWLLSRENVTVVPKATGEDQIRVDFAAQDLELDDENVERIRDTNGPSGTSAVTARRGSKPDRRLVDFCFHARSGVDAVRITRRLV